MRIKYWTVRFVFDPVRIGSTGLGLVALDEERGEATTRFLSGEEQIFSDSKLKKAALHWATRLERDISAVGNTPQLNVGEHSTVDGFINRLQRQMNNAIRIDSPGFASGDSLEQVADLLFHTLIGPNHHVPRKQRLTIVRNQVRTSYTARAMIREKLFRKPELLAGDREADLDLAIAGDEVYELNTSFSFAVRPTRNLANKIDAWTYKIGLIRSDGGLLKLEDEREYSVDDSTPVVAVVELPESKEQRELFSEVTKTWNKLGIRQITTANLELHAAELDHQILSA